MIERVMMYCFQIQVHIETVHNVKAVLLDVDHHDTKIVQDWLHQRDEHSSEVELHNVQTSSNR